MTTYQLDAKSGTTIQIREIVYDPVRKEDFNQNNIRELTPFRACIEEEHIGPLIFTHHNLYILDTFWNKLSKHPSAIANIRRYYSPNDIVVVGNYCDFSDGDNDEAGYWMVYRAWCQMYNADKWFHVFGNLAVLVPVTSECQKILLGRRALTPDLDYHNK